VALRADCSAGSATFTTVPSMKTILEPRMVVARIQPPPDGACSEQGVEIIRASSQGGLAKMAIIDSRRDLLARLILRTGSRSGEPALRFYEGADQAHDAPCVVRRSAPL